MIVPCGQGHFGAWAGQFLVSEDVTAASAWDLVIEPWIVFNPASDQEMACFSVTAVTGAGGVGAGGVGAGGVGAGGAGAGEIGRAHV